MPASNLTNKTIPELVSHFTHSSTSLVQEGFEALMKGDRAAFDRVGAKAAQSDVARLVTNLVTSSEKHCQALMAQADRLGNSGKMFKGVILLALGVGALVEAKALAAFLAVSVGAVMIVGTILLLYAILEMFGAVLNNGWEKLFSDGIGDF